VLKLVEQKVVWSPQPSLETVIHKSFFWKGKQHKGITSLSTASTRCFQQIEWANDF
jgi:hypothetical protein